MRGSAEVGAAAAPGLTRSLESAASLLGNVPIFSNPLAAPRARGDSVGIVEVNSDRHVSVAARAMGDRSLVASDAGTGLSLNLSLERRPEAGTVIPAGMEAAFLPELSAPELHTLGSRDEVSTQVATAEEAPVAAGSLGLESVLSGGQSGGSAPRCCAPPGPVAEGDEAAKAAMPQQSVTFGTPSPKHVHHRHKSSNYSRLVDVRVDDWCAHNAFSFT
jgi:hypothetical protein